MDFFSSDFFPDFFSDFKEPSFSFARMSSSRSTVRSNSSLDRSALVGSEAELCLFLCIGLEGISPLRNLSTSCNDFSLVWQGDTNCAEEAFPLCLTMMYQSGGRPGSV